MTSQEFKQYTFNLSKFCLALNREHWVSLVLLAALALAAMSAYAEGEMFYVDLASHIAIMALAGVGLNLALGFGGMVSLGHAAFFGLGGYVVAIGAFHAFEMSPILGIDFLPHGCNQMLPLWLLAMLVSGVVAYPIGKLSIRTAGVYFIMITLAFAQMIYYFAISWPAYGGEDGLPIYIRNQFYGLDTNNTLLFFALCFGLLILTMAFCRRIIDARFGAALTMARLNPIRLATAGVEPAPVRLVGFIISGMITGLAGALFAELNGFVGPSMLSWHQSGQLIVIVVLGGVGRHGGPLAGAIVFVLLETFLGGLTEYWQLLLGFILLGVVLYARGGLMGLLAGRARHV